MSTLDYSTRPSSKRGGFLHAIALVTAIATFPLIFMGGLVTSHHAGMSVPDWPNSYGYNMFMFPPSKWVGGIFYEHTHRLMGTVVGMLSIVLAVAAWKLEPRKWVRRLAYGVLAAVIIQGILGGLRVVLVKLDLAIVHACLAQAFFCLAAAVSIVTSSWWHAQRDTGIQPVRSDPTLLKLAVAACVIIYLQLFAGAIMRHYQAGLAIPDFPASYGRLIPPTNSNELDRANTIRAFKLDMEMVTLNQIWIHFSHRVGALLVSVALITLIIHVIRKHHTQPELFHPALILIVLLTAQLFLGALTVLRRKPADIATLHVATGALTLLTTFVLTLRAFRMYARSPLAASRDATRPINVPLRNPLPA
jgi:cytochrome c oxidase assembly protein subunit 15